MTGATLKRRLRVIYFALTGVLALSLLAKLGALMPDVVGNEAAILLAGFYDYLKDMSLIFITVVATYLAYVLQKRASFTQRLDREWRGIVKTKSTLYRFCETANPSADDYLHAFCHISETLDNMRSVYRNVGETGGLIGLYPYEPLHDMRRILISLDPRKHPDVAPGQRKLARDAILQCFYALRENFLEELDLEQPSHPLLVSGGRRLKHSGGTPRAYRGQKRQIAAQTRSSNGCRDIDAYLATLKAAEVNARATTPVNSPPAATANSIGPSATMLPPSR